MNGYNLREGIYKWVPESISLKNNNFVDGRFVERDRYETQPKVKDGNGRRWARRIYW